MEGKVTKALLPQTTAARFGLQASRICDLVKKETVCLSESELTITPAFKVLLIYTAKAINTVVSCKKPDKNCALF